MLEHNLARLRAHRNNIHRYRRLLRTQLTDTERAFIMRRLDEEQSALDELSSETFPVTSTLPAGLPSIEEASHA